MMGRKTSWADIWSAPFTAMATGKAVAETIVASNAVITKRMPMIFQAFTSPLSADYPELALMTSEKIDAFEASKRSGMARGKTLKTAFDGQAAAAGRLSASGWLTPADWWGVAERNLTICSSLWALPGEMLAPYHKGVTANARRLKG